MNENRDTNEERLNEIIHNFLTHFSFFNRFNEEELSIIAQYINILEIEPGQVLFKEGEQGDCVYFIVDGELDVIKESVSGSRVGIDMVVISKLSRGRSIGEMSIIDNIPRSATVKARTEAALVTLTSSGFDSICKDYPNIGIRILKGISRILSMNLRQTSSRLADHMLSII